MGGGGGKCRAGDRFLDPPRRADMQGSAAVGRFGRRPESRPDPPRPQGFVRPCRDGSARAARAAVVIRARVLRRCAGRSGGHGMTIPRKVAVLGAGEIGVGWAALCASAGWAVAVFYLEPSRVETAAGVSG